MCDVHDVNGDVHSQDGTKAPEHAAQSGVVAVVGQVANVDAVRGVDDLTGTRKGGQRQQRTPKGENLSKLVSKAHVTCILRSTCRGASTCRAVKAHEVRG